MATGRRHKGSGVFIADPPLSELGPLEDDPKFAEVFDSKVNNFRQQSIRNNECGCEIVKHVNTHYVSLLWLLALSLLVIVLACVFT